MYSIPGLTDRQVVESRIASGPNTLPLARRRSFHIVLGILSEPMLLLLMATTILYFVTDQFQEGIAMCVALVLVAGLSVMQEVRSERALDALRNLVRPIVTVFRNGVALEIPVEEVVVGDMVQLTEGGQIPADGSLFSANDLTINEAILTGESMPVSKSQPGESIFAGTTVLSGSAVVEVTAVGIKTKLGMLGKSLEEINAAPSPLQRQIRRFVSWMAFLGTSAFLLVWLLHYLQGGDILHSLFHGLTLAMAVLPEEIPVALTTFMALGAYRMVRKRILVRQVQKVETLGAATVICVDKTGTITENSMSLVDMVVPVRSSQPDPKGHLLLCSRLACEVTAFDPMEKAILEKWESSHGDMHDFVLVHEYSLGGRYPIMTHVYRKGGRELFFAVKGSPEGVLNQSSISPDIRMEVDAQLEKMTSKGHRVLAVGYAVLPADVTVPATQDLISFEFAGLLVFSDPVKYNIPDVIREFNAAGIRVKMITGDHPSTACHIAAVAGLLRPNRFLTGEQLHAMSEAEIRKAVHEVDVFARSMPETKLRIIRALKDTGEVVAMTGDGVNDAPALKAADIGVSMGRRGSEVARQASSIVLLDDDLSVMVHAIGHGRRIYTNLKKAIGYIVTIHLPILLVVLVPLLLGWKYVSVFTPIHIIFLELVMGPTCSVVFESEPAEPDAMRRPPRPATAGFFTWRELSTGLIKGLVIAIALVGLIGFGTSANWSESYTRTVVFLSLMWTNIFLTLTSRSDHFPVWVTLQWRNPLLWVVHSMTIGFIIVSFLWPLLYPIFGFCSVSWQHQAAAILLAGVAVLWTEPIKAFRARSTHVF